MWIPIVIAVCILIVYIVAARQEDFATKADKARATSEWFASVEQPTYKAYRRAIPESDIVEYERIRAQVAAGASVGEIARAM